MTAPASTLVPVADVAQHAGWEISLTGMMVVFTTLSLIALFITVLPRIVAHLDRIWPPSEDHITADDAAVTVARDDGEITAVLAAFITHMESRGKKP